MSNNTLYANVNELYLTYLLSGGGETLSSANHYMSLKDCAHNFFKTEQGGKFLSKYSKMDKSPIFQFLKEADIPVSRNLIAKNTAMRTTPPKNGADLETILRSMPSKERAAFNACKQEMLDDIYKCWCNNIKKYGSWQNDADAKTEWETKLKEARKEDEKISGKKLNTLTNTDRAIIHAIHMSYTFLHWASKHGYKNPKRSWWVNTPERYNTAMTGLGFGELSNPAGGHPMDVMVEFNTGPGAHKVSGPYLLGLSAKSTKTNCIRITSFG